MSINLINSSILPKQFSTAVNKHCTIQIDYTYNASRSTIQTVLLNTYKIMKGLFNYLR